MHDIFSAMINSFDTNSFGLNVNESSNLNALGNHTTLWNTVGKGSGVNMTAEDVLSKGNSTSMFQSLPVK
jgi:hypothetical protein